MDIINSQIDHLGYHGAQAYGASWKVYSTDASLLPPNSRELYNRADVFGVIQNSTITQNYFGAYTFGSYCMNSPATTSTTTTGTASTRTTTPTP